MSDAVFVATANSLGAVPRMWRERMSVLDLPGYTEREKRVIATRHLLPWQLAPRGLTADQFRVTDAAVVALVHGYSRQRAVWGLDGPLARLCRNVLRRRIGEAPVEVMPDAVVRMLDAPEPPGAPVRHRTGRPGVAVGMGQSPRGGDLLFVEAAPMPGSGRLTLTGRQGGTMQESARTALTWLRTKRPALRPRPALPSPHRRPSARRLRRGAQRRGVRQRRHGRRARLGVHGTRHVPCVPALS